MASIQLIADIVFNGRDTKVFVFANYMHLIVNITALRDLSLISYFGWDIICFVNKITKSRTR